MPKATILPTLFAAVLLLRAQTPGPQILTFHSDIGGSEQPYAIYLPPSIQTGAKLPLLVSLHSEDTSHLLNLRQVLGVSRPGAAVPLDMRLFPPVRGIEFIVACPSARGSVGYRGIAEQDVYDMVADITRRFPVDPDRIYLTGISMGGEGALRLGLTRPDVWAALAPVATAEAPGAEEFAGNALDLPIRFYHGEHDPINPVETSRSWQRRLLGLDDPASYIEFPSVRHNAWDFAYRLNEAYAWFEKQRRNPLPERVRFTTRSYRYSRAYWVRIDGLTPGEPASIDARRAGPAELRVETQGVDGFTLTLDKASSAITIDGTALRIRPAAATLSFQKSKGRWQKGLYVPAGKRFGAEGPIAEAVAARHIYVYGTSGARTAEELDARRQIAETAAKWSTPRSRVSLSLPVKADRDVTPEDIESANLVLFGTSATNQVIARLASQLPLALSPGAADYGLLFIVPAGKHYVLVNSGLPWWTGADDSRKGGDPFAPRQVRLLESFGDYLLFKGSLAHVLAEGRFDRNWKMPAEAAAKLGCAEDGSSAPPLSCSK